MFEHFMQVLKPSPSERVLDVGVTEDRTITNSNYFEALYPWKAQITACGMEDARFLESQYPGLKFLHADALNLPFPDQSFDVVHCSAVWEHVGNANNQKKLLTECLRVTRRGLMLTTPNRWFPIEFHCQLPFLHWLPKSVFRHLIRHTSHHVFSQESMLNLLTPREVRSMASVHESWTLWIEFAHLLLLPSNILLFANRKNNQ